MFLNTTNSSNNATVAENLGEYFITFMYSITGMAAIFGNSLVFLSICKFQSLQGKVYILITNLAVSDFLVGLIVIPYEITFLHFEQQLNSKYGCLFHHCLPIIFLGASVWSLFCISLERYLAIVYPFTHVRKVTSNVLCVAVIYCWVSAISIGVLPIIGWNEWNPGTNCKKGHVLPEVYSKLFYGIYSCSLICNFIMYIKVVKTAWAHLKKRRMNSNELNNNNNNQVYQQKEKNRTRLTVILLGVFAFCWGPYLILLLFKNFLQHESYLHTALMIIFKCTAVLNSGLNWIVYGSCNRNMRQAFVRTLNCWKTDCESQKDKDVSSIIANTKL